MAGIAAIFDQRPAGFGRALPGDGDQGAAMIRVDSFRTQLMEQAKGKILVEEDPHDA